MHARDPAGLTASTDSFAPFQAPPAKGGSPWRAAGPASVAALPPELRHWALMEGSMTRALLQLAPQAQLQVLADGPCEAYPDEAQITGPAARLERREICFCLPCGTPLMAARTLYDLRGGPVGQSVRALGNRPLGALLFADGRSASWSLREIGCISPPHPLCGLLGGQMAGFGLKGPLWARRSRYWLGAEPLLVTEIFLPALQALLRAAAQDPALSFSPLASSDMP